MNVENYEVAYYEYAKMLLTTESDLIDTIAKPSEEDLTEDEVSECVIKATIRAINWYNRVRTVVN